jgi:transposase
MQQKTRKRYTREFKIETVKLITECGGNVSEIARDMGVHSNTLYKWIHEFSAKPAEAFPGKGHLANSDAEQIRQLQRENERLRMERDILKKAMAIFSKDPS